MDWKYEGVGGLRTSMVLPPWLDLKSMSACTHTKMNTTQMQSYLHAKSMSACAHMHSCITRIRACRGARRCSQRHWLTVRRGTVLSCT